MMLLELFLDDADRVLIDLVQQVLEVVLKLLLRLNGG
jgi:hypothetical protein